MLLHLKRRFFKKTILILLQKGLKMMIGKWILSPSIALWRMTFLMSSHPMFGLILANDHIYFNIFPNDKLRTNSLNKAKKTDYDFFLNLMFNYFSVNLS